MKVYVIRHGKVHYEWSARCTSAEFDRECMEYDEAAVEPLESRPTVGEFQDLYASTLSRSRATAKMLFEGRKIKVTPLLDEVPLRSSHNTKKEKSLHYWDVMGRLQWSVNHPRQPEGRRRTRKRARRFVEMICQEGVDCAVVTHGFYMQTLLREMQKAGFAMDKPRKNYKNGECVTAVFSDPPQG